VGALCAGCGDTSTHVSPAGEVATVDARSDAQGLIPTTVGRGPAFQPRARAPLASSCVAGPVAGRSRAHVELFARRHVVVVPAGIGLGAPLRRESGRVVGARCRAGLRTLDPAGVIDFDAASTTLGALFATWREPLGAARMLSFRAPVAVFVDGRRVHGDPRAVVLRDGTEVVVEAGGYVEPHSSFLFPPRRAGAAP
jgi:hypothetical protein